MFEVLQRRAQCARAVLEAAKSEVAATAQQSAHFAGGVIVVRRERSVVGTLADRALSALGRESCFPLLASQAVHLQSKTLTPSPTARGTCLRVLESPLRGRRGATLRIALGISPRASKRFRTYLRKLSSRCVVKALGLAARITATTETLVLSSCAVAHWRAALLRWCHAMKYNTGNSATYSVGYNLSV